MDEVQPKFIPAIRKQEQKLAVDVIAVQERVGNFDEFYEVKNARQYVELAKNVQDQINGLVEECDDLIRTQDVFQISECPTREKISAMQRNFKKYHQFWVFQWEYKNVSSSSDSRNRDGGSRPFSPTWTRRTSKSRSRSG